MRLITLSEDETRSWLDKTTAGEKFRQFKKAIAENTFIDCGVDVKIKSCYGEILFELIKAVGACKILIFGLSNFP